MFHKQLWLAVKYNAVSDKDGFCGSLPSFCCAKKRDVLQNLRNQTKNHLRLRLQYRIQKQHKLSWPTGTIKCNKEFGSQVLFLFSSYGCFLSSTSFGQFWLGSTL